ncbi:hypothetical protein GJ496_000108 [Pomphorhynchus laevis]|nr:hypothetical protein GJ496_000108 [Pomphorhynchus laevis]
MSDQKFDPNDLSAANRIRMKATEEANLRRVSFVLKKRRRARGYLALICGIALGTYGYTMYRVRQEDFLDTLDEPDK